MKKIFLLLTVAATILSSCNKVPISGRNQLNLVSDSEVLQSSLASYRMQFLYNKIEILSITGADVVRTSRLVSATRSDVV